MPVINGLKMACEPCIRGHRSTKCTHADERLMVPVKKPGRPLSSCPHLHNQPCSCSSVTAAIRRKQRCHCGTGISNGASPPVQPQPVASVIPDTSPPTKASFRVKKRSSSSRPGSRKPSFDLGGLERMDAGNINVVPFQARSTQPTVATPTKGPAYDTSTLQSPEQQLFPDVSFQLDDPAFDLPGSRHASHTTNGSYIPLEILKERFVDPVQPSGSRTCCGEMPAPRNGSAQPDSQAHIIQSPENGCCSSCATPHQSRFTSTSQGISGAPTSDESIRAQDSPFPGNPLIPSPIYPPYMSRATVFAYPPSYGSYQHPLQPSEWRKSVASNLYAQNETPPKVSSEIASFPSAEKLSNMDTFHTCSCGDGCQCIGCAAHPYNESTQKYVRSAYNMINEPSRPSTANSTNGHVNGIVYSPTSDSLTLKQNGSGIGHDNGESTSPRLANTPSDPGTGDELSLSASDFFFVNYPFAVDGCDGDTDSCPCGDDCQCIGCTIHRLDDPISEFPSEPIGNGHDHEHAESSATEALDTNNPPINGLAIKDEKSETQKTGKGCCCGI